MSIPWRIYDLARDFLAEKFIYTNLHAPVQDLSGQVILITGANAGLGRESARQLALMNPAKIIITARSMEKGEQAKNELIESTGFKNIQLEHLDLCSLDSVNKLSRKVLDTEKSLHVLLCNAGCGSLPDVAKKTQDGFDELFQGNVLGHHLLTTNLLPLLEKSGSSSLPARVVLLSSLAAKFAFSFDINSWDNPEKISAMAFYGTTKLMANLLATAYAERESGKNVAFHSCHPGTVPTSFPDKFSPFMKNYILPIFFVFVSRPLEQGAATQVYLASSPAGYESHPYWTNMESRPPNPLAQNSQLCRQFLEQCDELISKHKL